MHINARKTPVTFSAACACTMHNTLVIVICLELLHGFSVLLLYVCVWCAGCGARVHGLRSDSVVVSARSCFARSVSRLVLGSTVELDGDSGCFGHPKHVF